MARVKLLGLVLLIMAFTAAPAMAAGHMGLSVKGGYAFNISGDAIDDADNTEWDTGGLTGQADLEYRFPAGFSLGVSGGYLGFTANVKNSGVLSDDLGRLNLFPLMGVIKYQGMIDQGFTGYGEIGAGVAFTGYDRGDYLKDMDAALGTKTEIDTDSAFIGFIGGGIGYFFTPEWELTLGARVYLCNVDFTTKIKDRTTGVRISTTDDTLLASNVSVLLGLTYWWPVN